MITIELSKKQLEWLIQHLEHDSLKASYAGNAGYINEGDQVRLLLEGQRNGIPNGLSLRLHSIKKKQDERLSKLEQQYKKDQIYDTGKAFWDGWSRAKIDLAEALLTTKDPMAEMDRDELIALFETNPYGHLTWIVSVVDVVDEPVIEDIICFDWELKYGRVFIHSVIDQPGYIDTFDTALVDADDFAGVINAIDTMFGNAIEVLRMNHEGRVIGFSKTKQHFTNDIMRTIDPEFKEN